jgi:F-type H+-transporting ATPase subunit b
MAAGAPHDIPWKELVIPQIVNFTIFGSALVYLLRKPIRNYFSGKSEEFEKNKKKAEESKVAAERQNAEIKMQLKNLEESASRDIEKAKTDAKIAREQILKDASATASKLEEEALRLAGFEMQRAVAMLRAELIQNSTKLASDSLQSQLKTETKEALNDEFIKNVKAVF